MDKGDVVREVTISLSEYNYLNMRNHKLDEVERKINSIYNLVEDYATKDSSFIKFKGVGMEETFSFVNELLQLLYYLDGRAYAGIVENLKGE